jgi:hypothetical protein
MKSKRQNTLGFQPILKNKYLIILALLVILAILYPSYIARYDLWMTYIITVFIALVTFGLYQNIRFQKLHPILRPYIVTQILQAIASIGFLLLLLRTIPLAVQKGAYIPYGVFWLLMLASVYQFYDIFRLAKQAKKDFPDRCEFC